MVRKCWFKAWTESCMDCDKMPHHGLPTAGVIEMESASSAVVGPERPLHAFRACAPAVTLCMPAECRTHHTCSIGKTIICLQSA